jgi:hypothetical protein
MSSIYQKNPILAVNDTTTYGYAPRHQGAHIQTLNVSLRRISKHKLRTKPVY